MSAHTPGPWSVGTRSGHNANIVYSYNEDKGVCQIYGVAMNQRISELTERDAEGMVNARLIAAAPELLEALKEALKVIEFFHEETPFNPNSWGFDASQLAKTAIAKATGETR